MRTKGSAASGCLRVQPWVVGDQQSKELLSLIGGEGESEGVVEVA